MGEPISRGIRLWRAYPWRLLLVLTHADSRRRYRASIQASIPWRLLPALATALLAACSGLDPRTPRCDTAQAPSLPYSLISHTQRTDDLPDETVIAAHFYRIHSDPAAAKPCGEVAIIKEVRLRRASNRPLQVRERRVFYASDGTVVAQSEEDVGAYLPQSGNYRAVQVLPIPATTPAGHYRMVAELYLHEHDHAILLNRAETRLHIVAPHSVKSKAPTPPRRAPVARKQ